MTVDELIAALLVLPGVQEANVFTLRPGVARVCVLGGELDAVLAILKNSIAIGIRCVLEHRKVKGWACTEVCL